jgi:hypothetical protein
MHFAPQSARFSDDLDFFHDSVERIARARFVLPSHDSSLESQGSMPHYGAPGGVIPRVTGTV